MSPLATPSSPAEICPSFGRGSTDGDPLVFPLVQSTTFRRKDVGSNPPHQYSRVSNPTVSALEQALGDLEDAPPAVSFATGLAAETALFLAVLQQGDHVVLGRAIYGGTTRLVREILSGLGITASFVDSSVPAEIRGAIQLNTKLLFVETPANPTLELCDLRECAAIAKEHGLLLAVDNTFLTPLLQRPLDLGADISVLSTTKFIEGHSLALGGALVTRDAALADRLRFLRKSTGSIQSPFEAWLTLNGLRTLDARLERQCRSAQTIATWLQARPEVARVYYPTLFDERAQAIAAAQHRGAHGAVVSFELAADFARSCAFVGRLRRIALAEHVGSVDTLITHPASMTHADTPREQRLASGLADGLLRLSVGLEPVASIQADLELGFGALGAKPEDSTEVEGAQS